MEERITSGRFISGIDPVLESWHLPIPIYLFLGGLAAGILFFAGYFTVRGRADELPAAVKWASFLVPPALVLGLLALFLDLNHKLYFWRLYTTIRLESPMSWGAWTLLVITPMSFIWSATYMKELIPGWSWKFKFLEKFEAFAISQRKTFAWPMMILSIILGIYTGILLSAFNARPLWNTSILGPLFLISGLSTAAAAIMIMSKSKEEIKLFSRIDVLLISIELFLIVHLFMGMRASTQVQIEAINMFLGGRFTFIFWGVVAGLGLVTPAIMEIMKLRGFKIPVILPAGLILAGGLILRIIIVEAGQISSYF